MQQKRIYTSVVSAFLSLLLVFVFTLTATPQTPQVLAEYISSAAAAKTDNAAEVREETSGLNFEKLYDAPDYDKTEIIAEDTGRRTETSKTFVQADGTFVMQEYGTPVHYLKDGQFEEIDNTLNASLENTANDFKVDFGQAAGESLVRVSGETGAVSMTPVFAAGQTSAAEVYAYDGSSQLTAFSTKTGKNNAAQSYKPSFENNRASSLSILNIKDKQLTSRLENVFAKNNSGVYYSDVYSGVDIQYVLEGKSLKENIIINAPRSEYVFKFELNFENLFAHKTYEGDILLIDIATLKTMYTIPRGYMYDANGVYSYDVEYELEYVGDQCFLIVLADAAFFETAAFPVVVDPTIEYFENKHVIIGNYEEPFTDLIYYYIDLLPGIFDNYNKTIIEAKLSISGYYNLQYTFDAVTLQNTKIIDNFIHMTPFLYNLSTDYYHDKAILDVYPFVANYFSYAMILLTCFSGTWGLGFDCLVISYAEHQGIDSNDYNVIQDMGNSGQGVVSLNTGKMNYVYEDVTINDGYMPINISHIYDESFGDIFNGVGYGFKLNLQQKLMLNFGGNLQYYINETGKKYYFSELSSSYYNHELGLEVRNAGNVYFAIDRFGNSLVFNSYGYLIQMHQHPSIYENPKDGLFIKIALDYEFQITSVTNNKTVLNFVYNNGLLVNIKKNSNTLVSYGYQTLQNNNHLSSAEKHFDLSSSWATYFNYTDSLLTYIGLNNNLNYDLEYKYTSGKTSNIKTYYWDNNVRQNNSVDLTYHNSVPMNTYQKGEGVTRSVILNQGNIYQHVSFCNNSVVADYAFDFNGNIMTPIYAKSNGFDYFSFIDTYANTRDIMPFDTFNYSTKAITLNVAESGYNNYALSLWVNNTQSANQIEITVITANGWHSKSFSYSFNNNLLGWQFGTVAINDIADLKEVSIIVSCQQSTTIKNVRLVRLPKTPHETLPDEFKTKYNANNQVAETYSYNQLADTITTYTYQYESGASCGYYPGPIKSITERENNIQQSKTEYSYDTDYSLTSIKTYGSSSSYLLSNYVYDALGRIISITDENGITTNYNYKSDGTIETTVVGDTYSPSISTTDEYYQGSGLLKSTSTGGIQTSFGYNDWGGLQTIYHNNFNTGFVYDSNYNLAGVSVENQQLVNYTYSKNQDTVNYANDQSLKYNYNNDGCLTDMKYTDGDDETHTLAAFSYNSLGWLSGVSQSSIGVSYTYQYSQDLQPYGMGHVNLAYNMTNNNRPLTIHYSGADAAGNPTGAWYYTSNGLQDRYTYSYNGSGQLSSINKPNATITYGYDSLNRLSTKNTNSNNVNFNYNYAYRANGSATTNMLASEEFKVNDASQETRSYDYAANGNISRIFSSQSPWPWVEYYYDEYDRISWGVSNDTGLIFYYSYDNAGNITSRTEYDFNWNLVNQYTYTYGNGYNNNGWRDQMLSYTKNGVSSSLTYDNVGNPLNYRNGMEFTWQNGRELKRVDNAPNFGYAEMEYDYQGLRTKKSNADFSAYYLWEGNRLMAEERGGYLIWYYYDESGICGMTLDNQTYYFQKNALGDVVALYSASGQYLGGYNYDAWGNCTVNNPNGTWAVSVNPWRYRGYYYDQETGFYYLQSRYYDPQTCRFINADEPTTLFYTADIVDGANLYSYCLNNPVMYTDPTGENPIVAAILAIAAEIISALIVLCEIVVVATLIVAIESTFHPIENLIDSIIDWINSIVFESSSAGSSGGMTMGNVGSAGSSSPYNDPNPHRKKTPSKKEKHTQAEHARKMQTKQKKILNGKFKSHKWQKVIFPFFGDMFDNLFNNKYNGFGW